MMKGDSGETCAVERVAITVPGAEPMSSTVTAAPASPVIKASQTLWHVGRGAAATSVTAVLTRSAESACQLEVTFGKVARQCLRFGSALAAVEHAERLFER